MACWCANWSLLLVGGQVADFTLPGGTRATTYINPHIQ